MRGARTHDGLYLRLHLGVGLVSFGGSVTSRERRIPFEGGGPSSYFGVMLGGTPARGLAAGGAVAAQGMGEARDKRLYESAYDPGGEASIMWLAYGFIDYFPDPRKGWHFGGGAGPASLQYKSSDYGLGGNTTGAVGLLWAGYDFWTGEKWSVGAEARAVGVHFWPDADGAVSHRINVGGGLLMASVLLH